VLCNMHYSASSYFLHIHSMARFKCNGPLLCALLRLISLPRLTTPVVVQWGWPVESGERYAKWSKANAERSKMVEVMCKLNGS
jgi:hypothetical protein